MQIAHWGPSYSFLFHIPFPPCGNALIALYLSCDLERTHFQVVGLDQRQALFAAGTVFMSFPRC